MSDLTCLPITLVISKWLGNRENVTKPFPTCTYYSSYSNGYTKRKMAKLTGSKFELTLKLVLGWIKMREQLSVKYQTWNYLGDLCDNTQSHFSPSLFRVCLLMSQSLTSRLANTTLLVLMCSWQSCILTYFSVAVHLWPHTRPEIKSSSKAATGCTPPMISVQTCRVGTQVDNSIP